MGTPNADAGKLALQVVSTFVTPVWKVGSTLLCTLNPLSLAELSVHVSVTVPPFCTALKADGAGGGTRKLMDRIMSFSSWPRMWQCHTYSHPKFTLRLTLLIVALPLSGSRPEMFTSALSGMVTSIERTLSGNGN